MKMAKASERDLEASLAICRALESLHQGYLPDELTNSEDDCATQYDERLHAAKVVEYLTRVAGSASMFRVCFGMTVVLDPRNEVVDPDADTLEVHPKFEKMRAALEKISSPTQTDGLLWWQVAAREALDTN